MNTQAQPAAGTVKHSYTIPCASAFRDAVEALAAKRRVNVGDIARSVLLVMPPATIAAFTDPGDPAAEDRETVILKSGPAQG
ncbi:MAG TPA: J domain-containing protein, partial [Magnetospirillum sp.]|nr:J domain-containing protein [Magnetospirillum sp.]